MPKVAPSSCDTPHSPSLKPLDEVLERLQQLAQPTQLTEKLSLIEAEMKVLAQDLHAELNVPPADNSAVDGYALNTEDFVENKTYPISQRIPAGQTPTPLEKGSVARIFTGASIPQGANCVIMQENALLDENGKGVRFISTPQAHDNIRPCGQDVKAGQRILEKGSVLSPARIGLIASVGIPKVSVFKRLRVAIFSTGDELVEPGQTPGPSQIYNSNRYLLTALLKSLNMEVIDLGLIPDQLSATTLALQDAAKQADVVISTGGASVGEEDHVKTAIKSLGSIDFWRIAIKPGKPFMYGQINETPVLGLPGNPGAVFVTFAILARPFLLYSQGLNSVRTPSFKLPLGFSIKKSGPRREFLRVQVDENNQLIRHPNQSSGMLSSASWADGFAVIKEKTQPGKGEEVAFIPFSGLFGLFK